MIENFEQEDKNIENIENMENMENIGNIENIEENQENQEDFQYIEKQDIEKIQNKKIKEIGKEKIKKSHKKNLSNSPDQVIHHPANFLKEGVLEIKGALTLTPYFFIFQPEYDENIEIGEYFFHTTIESIVDSLIVQLPPLPGEKIRKNEFMTRKILQIVLKDGNLFHFTGPDEIQEIHNKLTQYINKNFKDRQKLVEELFDAKRKKQKEKKKKSRSKKKQKEGNKSKGSNEEQENNQEEKKTEVSKPRHIRPRYKIKLDKKSKILTEEMIESIQLELPSYLRKYDWEFLYGTYQSGTSFHTFFANTEQQDNIIFCIKNEENEVFGAYIEESLRKEYCYYGSNSMFLFSFYPKFQVWRWKDNNNCFVVSNEEFIAFGGVTHYGIWITRDLYHGSTQTCETFENPPLCSKTSFNIFYLEIWKIGKKKIVF
ncbi:mtor-associated protein meak7 [Anaeramoeba ignava]|uniref:Oxidation resistance protein 1 n=1 Tax=Anaeramoeba ignava TaxID=1746090 RepID=A0A9Q0RHI6_ANAIG|nr:mtor-associated protein meak7 [Anaeramoeba ignava]